MKHHVTFYPVGNGDTSQIVLHNGRRILMDFHHLTKTEQGEGPEINLAKQLREELATAQRDYYDVAAFTHGDEDHIKGSSDFFELEHAAKYQGNGRVKMREMWIPAAMLVETGTNTQQSSDRILLRQEARYRLQQGKGIRVFSRPDMLKQWMHDNDIDYEARKHLFVDAGQLVPGFSLISDGVEFFVHSPFVEHTDQGDDLRNRCALIFNVRFVVNGVQTDYLAVGDSDCDVLSDIVRITEYHNRLDRLQWDLFNIPHHCSAYALAYDKGEKETVPLTRVQQLLRLGKSGAFAISSSNPVSRTQAAYEQSQPPHIQARNTYEKYLREVNGRKFIVTMEEPSTVAPKPLVFEIGHAGCFWKQATSSGAAIATSIVPPRAG
ncbi:MAG TPA: hypothetical protein VF450_26950 [Noviherbaspirillum sp.]